MDLARQVVDVHLHLIEPRFGEGEAHQPVNPYDPAAASRQGEGVEQAAGTAVVGLGALADLARANVGIHVPILPGQIRQPSNQGRRHGLQVWRPKWPPKGVS